MAESRTFTIRPLSRQARSDLKDALRVYLSSASLLSLKLRAGDLCRIDLNEGGSKNAIAWAALEKIQDTVVQTSKTLQEVCGLRLGDQVSILKQDDPIPEVDVAILTEITGESQHLKMDSLSTDERRHWEWLLEYPLQRSEFMCPGLIFEQVEVKGHRRSFKIQDIQSRSHHSASTLFRFTGTSRSEIRTAAPEAIEQASVSESILEVSSTSVGGLERQISQINEALRDFSTVSPDYSMPSYYRSNSGILLYGSKGSGKSLLLERIAAAPWQKVFRVNSSVISRNVGEGEAALKKILSDALRHQPSLILIDQLNYIAPKRGALDSNVPHSLSSVLCEALDGIRDARVLVAAAARHPNDVDEALRTPMRLGMEIEIPIPTAKDRIGILRAIRDSANQPSDDLLDIVAERTHGYVGADLFALLQLACRKARARCLLTTSSQALNQVNSLTPLLENDAASKASQTTAIPLDVLEDDMMDALQETRPTAMQEVFLETPKVRWRDIGGQHEIKRRLQKAVERPLKYPDRMENLNINSKKGILLYGPPGCSKTLMVKALSTEAGLNFLAVKGAEILSMYVGESERALREIFRKARSASPSIIFFDEIDAIASKRGERSSDGGLNVLTTLLNEMDGIEELKNVLVVAATNKPEMLDPALMRPGRLDNILYIGPPDLDARKEILNIWFHKSDIAEDVDIYRLAEQTEGYSGAEIVSICDVAGEAALDDEEEFGIEQQISWKHFQSALSQVERQITGDVIKRYEDWSKKS